MSFSIPRTEILLIRRYQHITTQTKKYLTRKHDILRTPHYKGDHIKMTTITKMDSVLRANNLSRYYKDPCSAGSLTHQPSNVANNLCNLMGFLSPMHKCQ